MAETGAFPESAIQLVRVGEESGNLAGMLSHISTYHGEQAERRLTRALSLIEPAIILVLGGVVALIVLVLMSAVGDLNKLVL
jgi:general secretion pathway protein F